MGKRAVRSSSLNGDITKRERWRMLAARVCADPAPWSCAAFGLLYKLAIAEGHRKLRTYRSLDGARREDLASTVLLEKRDQIVGADDPLAFFRCVLGNEANSWLRRRDAAVEADPAFGDAHWMPEGGADDEERRVIAWIDGRRAFAKMAPRARTVLLAVAEGASRDEIADREGTSRANIDQIVHRARHRAAHSGAELGAA